jgi:HK97 family phage prohead protease
MTMEYRYMRKAAPSAGEDRSLSGRAWVYGSPTQIGRGPAGFRETIKAGAGKKSVNDGDIVLLDNHQSHQPLARMSAGTLELKDGSNGGDWTATAVDTSYADDVLKNVRAKNYGGCSFGFEVIKDRWTDDEGRAASPMNGTRREILEMKVHEISVCTFPAYGDTFVSSREQIRTARGIAEERAAAATYSDLYTCGECSSQQQYGAFCTNCGESMAQKDIGASGDYCASCGAKMEDRDAHQCTELRDLDAAEADATSEPDENAEERDADKPYGNVTYADPGYQSDGKKRYPVDTEKHAMAAWSYINKAKNAAKYTAQQLAKIRSKIKSALAKFGVKTQEANMADWEALCDFREMVEGYDPEGENDNMDYRVYPGDIVGTEDANNLARAIKAASDRDERVAAINLATDLGLGDLLPPHWSANGDIGAGANEETQRDMVTIYEMAMKLHPTREALHIINLAEAYLSNETIDSAREAAEAEEKKKREESAPLTAERLQQSIREAQQRLSELSD